MTPARRALRKSSPPAGRAARSDPGAIRNELLAALPPQEYARLRPRMDVIALPLKQVLHRPGDTLEYVYFPGGGFCSVLTLLTDGDMVEVATVGREGFVGVSAVLEPLPAPGLAMVQATVDVCYRMPAFAFREEMRRREAFSALVTQYTHALLGAIMQGTACNVVHSVEQRLARWLLLAQDRVEAEEFPLTQEFMAMMLGATRPTVTLVAGTLHRAGLITYRHGRLRIVDRQGLEHVACECYGVTTRTFGSVVPNAAKARR